MIFAEALGVLLAVLATLLLAGTWVVVGRARVLAGVRRGRDRLSAIWRHLALLGVVLLLNKVARDYGPAISWILEWNLTTLIYRIEGTAPAWIQSLGSPGATVVFGAVYIFGYAFLLVFPFVLYFFHESSRPLRRTTIAFVLNYAVGVFLYTLFVAYGPRNVMPDLVEPLLFTEFPASKLITSRVNTNTNVFPSLHSSLSITVAVLAWQTREQFPRWPPIALPLAGAVLFSTVYLGIHWIIDVVAGVALGLGSVAVATRIVEDPDTG
ncbi:MAG: phosphatase PAP2 family protein [Halanaeroarchaeum sp.]